MNREAWLKERQTGVGSSDAPSLVGVGFGTAADVFREKLTPPDPREPATGVLARGIALEPLVGKMYAERFPNCRIAKRTVIDRHPERDWQIASVDFMGVLVDERDNDLIVEAKTTVGFGDDWGPDGLSRVPDGYFVQVQHQLGVTGERLAHVAALDIMGWSLRVYPIPADPEFFGLLTEVQSRFWKDHVLARVEPGPEWEEKYGGAVREAIPVPAGRVTLPAMAADMLAKREELKSIRDMAEAAYREQTEAIELMLGDAQEGVLPGWKVRKVYNAGGPVPATVRKPYTYLTVRRVKEKNA
jgi:putative phage-type endonuclease